MTLYSRFSDHIETALDALVAKGALPDGLDRAAISARLMGDARAAVAAE